MGENGFAGMIKDCLKTAGMGLPKGSLDGLVLATGDLAGYYLCFLLQNC